MGVLKTLVGGDWRKVGCGGAAAAPSFGDDFDRADSLTSVGGTGWVAQKGTWGILDNRLVCRGLTGGAGPAFPGGSAVLRKDSGSTTFDFTFEHRRRYHSGTSGVLFGYDPSTNQGYWFELNVFVNGGAAAVRRYDNGSETSLSPSASGTPPYWSGFLTSSALLRVTFDPGTGDIEVFRDGVSVCATTDSSPFTTGTWHGVLSNAYEGDGFSTNDAWDAPPSATGRLRLEVAPGVWVREACDDDTGLTYTDTFDRADASTLGADWTELVGTWGIDSNEATLDTPAGTNSDNFVVHDSGLADCTISAIYTTVTNGGYGMGLVFRATDSSNMFLARIGSGTADIMRVMGGSYSVISGSTSATVTDGDVVSVVLSGTSITVKLNGTTVAGVTSSFNQTATQHGLWATTVSGGGAAIAGVTKWNNFTVTDPAAPVAHPLKIEDPDNPGTWITVACFVPV